MTVTGALKEKVGMTRRSKMQEKKKGDRELCFKPCLLVAVTSDSYF